MNAVAQPTHVATAVAFLQSTFANDYDTLLSLAGENVTLIDHRERKTYRTEAEHADAIAADVVWADREFELSRTAVRPDRPARRPASTASTPPEP